jgi:hypothetical protein
MGVVPAARHAGNARRRSARRRRSGRIAYLEGMRLPATGFLAGGLDHRRVLEAEIAASAEGSVGCMSALAPRFPRLYRAPSRSPHRRRQPLISPASAEAALAA